MKQIEVAIGYGIEITKMSNTLFKRIYYFHILVIIEYEEFGLLCEVIGEIVKDAHFFCNEIKVYYLERGTRTARTLCHQKPTGKEEQRQAGLRVAT